MAAAGGARGEGEGVVSVDLHEMGGRVLSVFGPFGSRTLIELPTDVAQEMFPDGLAFSGRPDVVEATEREVAALGERAPEVGGSALASAAVALAYELTNPFNSATSKSMCARELREAMARLRELAPPKAERDRIDEVARKREARRRSAGT